MCYSYISSKKHQYYLIELFVKWLPNTYYCFFGFLLHCCYVYYIICQHKNSIWGRGKSFFVKAWMTSHRLAFTKRCQFLLVHPAVFLSRLSHVPPIRKWIYLFVPLTRKLLLTYFCILDLGFLFTVINILSKIMITTYHKIVTNFLYQWKKMMYNIQLL